MRFLDGQRNRLRSVKQADDRADCFYRIHGYPTVINSYTTYLPIALIDTNDATPWVSTTKLNATPWCKLDLGSPKIITKMRIYEGTGTDRATQYKLEASNDDASYYIVHTSAAALVGGEYLVYIPCLKYRYWKWTALAGNASFGWTLYSAELWGPTV